MPMYDFACNMCARRVNDVYVSNFTDAIDAPDTLRPCGGVCGGVLRRLPAAPAVKVVDGTPKFHA